MCCCQHTQAVYPGFKRKRAASRCGNPQTLSLLDLAPAGGCLAAALRQRRWSLTPPFHPYPWGRYVSVARSSKFFRRILTPGVARQLALRSADFPRGIDASRSSGQPDDFIILVINFFVNLLKIPAKRMNFT